MGHIFSPEAFSDCATGDMSHCREQSNPQIISVYTFLPVTNTATAGWGGCMCASACFPFFLREAPGRGCICYTRHSRIAVGNPRPFIHNAGLQYTVLLGLGGACINQRLISPGATVRNWGWRGGKHGNGEPLFSASGPFALLPHHISDTGFACVMGTPRSEFLVLLAPAVLVVHVHVQQDQYPCCCCQDRITRGSDPLDRRRIHEELSSPQSVTTGGGVWGLEVNLKVISLAFIWTWGCCENTGEWDRIINKNQTKPYWNLWGDWSEGQRQKGKEPSRISPGLGWMGRWDCTQIKQWQSEIERIREPMWVCGSQRAAVMWWGRWWSHGWR